MNVFGLVYLSTIPVVLYTLALTMRGGGVLPDFIQITETLFKIEIKMFKFLDFSKLMIENRKQKNKFKNHASRHVRVVSMLEVVRVVPMHAGGCEGVVHACWRLSG